MDDNLAILIDTAFASPPDLANLTISNQGCIDNNFSASNVILLGDLNDNLTDDAENNIFQDLIDDSANYLFLDMNIAQGNSLDWSYPTWPSHLDHILISDELFEDLQNPNSLISVIKIDEYMGGWSNYDNNVSDHRPIGIKLDFNIISSINESINIEKKVVKGIDVLGKEIPYKRNTPLFYIYDDGTVEKRMIVE